MKQDRIYSIKSVDIAVLEDDKQRRLRITACGIASTPGWSAPELDAYVYIQPPADGIYDFSFVAVPPAGPVPQVLQPISVTLLIDNWPHELRGVRVHAATNAVEAPLERYEPFPSPLENA